MNIRQPEKELFKTMYVGVDPGLNHPAIAVIDEDRQVVSTTHFDGTKIVALDQYAKAFMVGKLCADAALRAIPSYHCNVVLCIEGSPFIKHSRSIESMAKVRQAIYDAFETIRDAWASLDLTVPKPAQVKQLSSGKKTKEDIYQAVRHLYPSLNSLKESHRTVQKGKKAGEKELTKEVEAISDAIAIALAGIRIKEGELDAT